MANAEFGISGIRYTSYEIVSEGHLKVICTNTTDSGWYYLISNPLNIDLAQTSQVYASCYVKPFNYNQSFMLFHICEKGTTNKVASLDMGGKGAQFLSGLYTIPSEYRNENYELRILFYACAGEVSPTGGYIEYSDIMVATEELPYEPYFEGLRSAKVTSLKSEGKNLFDISKALNDNLVDNGDGTYTLTNNGGFNRYSKIVPMFIPANTPFAFGGTHISGDIKAFVQFIFADSTDNKSYPIDEWGRTETYPNDLLGVQIYMNGTEGQSVTFSNYQIEYGTKATEYTPYIGTLDTLALPEAVQSLEGYGLGVNSEYFNYIDYSRKVFVQRVKEIVFDGTEYWKDEYTGENTFYRVELPLNSISQRIGICNLYNFDSVGSITTMQGWFIVYDAFPNRFRVRPDLSLYPDVASWKAHLAELYASGNPLTFVYALTDPIETDISAYLTEDNLIEVEGGGSITAVNEYELATPSKIQFVSKVGG